MGRLLGSMTPLRSAEVVTLGGGDIVVDPPSRGIWVGSAGTLIVELIDGSAEIPFAGIAAGTLIPVQVKRIVDSGTTAGGIIIGR